MHGSLPVFQDPDNLANNKIINMNKIAEKLISKIIISDMKNKIDPSQYANQPGLSIQHYLVKFIDRMSSSLDKTSKSFGLKSKIKSKKNTFNHYLVHPLLAKSRIIVTSKTM